MIRTLKISGVAHNHLPKEIFTGICGPSFCDSTARSSIHLKVSHMVKINYIHEVLKCECWGNFFYFLFIFVFSLTCYRVFFSVPSGISLVTLLCYLLYVNFVIVYYLALIDCQFFTGLLVSHHSSK